MFKSETVMFDKIWIKLYLQWQFVWYLSAYTCNIFVLLCCCRYWCH